MADKTKSIKNATDKELEEPIESLYHAGVLGMRWGRRRGPAKSTVTVKKVKPLPHEDYQNARELKKKGMRNLSNTELKALNNRLQLEKQYKDLNKASVSSGQKWVQTLLLNVATQTISNYASKSATKGLESVLGKVV